LPFTVKAMSLQNLIRGSLGTLGFVPHPTLNFRRALKRTNQDPFGN
jgi:hypothetical protein